MLSTKCLYHELQHCYRNRKEQNEENRGRRKNKIFESFSNLMARVFFLDDGAGWNLVWNVVWAYLRIRCHPCPRCQRWTGQTSADQGWRCAQTVSATHHTSFQRELNACQTTKGKKKAKGAQKYWYVFPKLLLLLKNSWNVTALGINPCASMLIKGE